MSYYVGDLFEQLHGGTVVEFLNNPSLYNSKGILQLLLAGDQKAAFLSPYKEEKPRDNSISHEQLGQYLCTEKSNQTLHLQCKK